MNKTIFYLIGLVALIIAVILFMSAYLVSEKNQVVLTQFGKPVGKPVLKPGIHFKVPFIQSAHYFDKRFLEWDGDKNQVPTKDKRFIWVDTYARWRISDPLLFFQRLKDEQGAQSRLDDILDGEVRNAVAKHNLVEIVRSTNRKVMFDDESDSLLTNEIITDIEAGRERIMQDILESAAKRTSDLGIEVLDFRIKRIDYVDEVRRKVYERMISERQRIAEKFRSEGNGEASRILGEKDRELKRIQSDAYRISQEIIGQADAQAASIYAAAYDQSPQSREFYQFIKSMETLEQTMDQETWLLLSTKGDFLRYIQRSQ